MDHFRSARRVLFSAALAAFTALDASGELCAADAVADAPSHAVGNTVSITGQRIKLRDVLPGCPARACEADLGPAPPPASSRLVSTPSMLKAIDGAGENPAPFLSQKAVRVTSASRTLTPSEVGEMVRPSIERVMPVGVRIVAMEAKASLTIPLTATAGECTLPPLPRRAGPLTTTALVDVLHDGVRVRREPVLLRLVIGQQAARPDVPRGHTVTLTIERRSATISAYGVALKDGEIGEVVPFKVQRTGKVVRARVVSATAAVVEEDS